MLGDIEIKREIINGKTSSELKKRYIAIDVETTGLDPVKNQITEIGLVLFENGQISKKYNSLIRVDDIIPQNIVELTGITNEMIQNAPSPKRVYGEVVEFLGNALEEQTILVAHNALFDLSFLQSALKQYGYIGVIRYVDTLNISRSLIKGLFNYKQDTVATYFNIVNERAHRALTDAEVCGKILFNLLNVYDNQSQIVDFETQYDDQFEKNVIERGIIYYRFNTITNYIEDDNTCTGNISGSTIYKTTLTFENNIIGGTCTCPYYKDNQKKCKHMYALLLKHQSNKIIK